MADTLNVRPLVMERTGLRRDALAGEVALITGGGGNIGLGTARSLAWLGANIVIAQRTAQTGAAAAALIDRENGSGRALFVETDIADRESVKALARKAVERFGRVDILVNNAMPMGIGGQSVLDTDVDVLDKQYAVSTRGTALCLQAFVPAMRERHHGVVSYLASGFRMPTTSGTYYAIKAGTSAMIMGLAGELGDPKQSGVAVFMMVPGWVAPPRPVEATAGPLRQSFPGINVGYDGPMPPEDLGAGLAYAIVHAGEIHGSGITVGQVHKYLKWPFPRPDLVPKADFDRIRDAVGVRLLGYLGPGFARPGEPKVSVSRSAARPGESLNFITFMNSPAVQEEIG
jgi:NAD(P)-dependent dehydrogenase (short-subunit alcohol dehydrogenase family)